MINIYIYTGLIVKFGRLQWALHTPGLGRQDRHTEFGGGEGGTTW